MNRMSDEEKIILKKEINKFSVISFDIFDTLVFRNVSAPRKIFDIVELVYNTKKYKKIPFKDIRINSEIKAVKKIGREISYDDIYIEIEKSVGKSCAEELKRLEIEIELALTIVNEEMFEIYKLCLSMGKTIIMISDMYLPKEIIEQILRKNAYTEYFRVYVSNEYGCSKRNGELYRVVCKDLRVMPSCLLHIGDSLISDGIMALKSGIHIYNYRRHLKNDHQSSITGDVLSSFLHNQSISLGYYYQIGYDIFGPLLYGFINWIVKMTELKKYDKILFFSRDGYIMKKVFDSLYQGNTESIYFYASRRVLLVSALWMNADYDYLISSMYIPIKMSACWFINSIGLNSNDFSEEVKKFGFNLETVFLRDTLHKEKRLRSFFGSIKQKVIDNSKKEYEAFILYLKKKEITGRVAIVDIGWIGSMQAALDKIIKSEDLRCQIEGLYLGVVPQSENQNLIQMSGYLFQKEKNLWLYKEEYFLNDIVELFFLAPHGSALYYYVANGELEIMLDKFEYKDTETYRIFSIIQQGAEKFVADFNTIGKLIPNDEIEYSKFVISKFGNPSLKLVESFGDLLFFEKKWYYLAKPKKLIHYIIKPGELKKDIFNAQWKVGFMKRLVKLNLPYNKMLYSAMYLNDKWNEIKRIRKNKIIH